MSDQPAGGGERPLAGRRILVTRARAQAGALTAQLQSLGAEVVEMPTIEIEPVAPDRLRGALASLGDYQWIAFTSQNAVRLVFEELGRERRDVTAFGGARIIAVGPKTADALRAQGVQVAVTPERYVAEGVLDVMRGRADVRGTRVLYLAAEGARDVLPVGLRELGAQVDVVPIYRSAPVRGDAGAVRALLERGDIDVVTFASGSAVQGYAAAVGRDAARRAPAASIGPVTSEAVRREGIPLAVEAVEHTTPGLVAAIVGVLRRA